MYVSDAEWEVRSLSHVTRDWVQSLVSTYATVIAAGGTYALWHMWQQAGSLSAGKLAYLALYYASHALGRCGRCADHVLGLPPERLTVFWGRDDLWRCGCVSG